MFFRNTIMFLMLRLTHLFCFSENLVLRVVISCAVTILMLLMVLCLWWINKLGQMIGGESKGITLLSEFIFCSNIPSWFSCSNIID